MGVQTFGSLARHFVGTKKWQILYEFYEFPMWIGKENVLKHLPHLWYRFAIEWGLTDIELLYKRLLTHHSFFHDTLLSFTVDVDTLVAEQVITCRTTICLAKWLAIIIGIIIQSETQGKMAGHYHRDHHTIRNTKQSKNT